MQGVRTWSTKCGMFATQTWKQRVHCACTECTRCFYVYAAKPPSEGPKVPSLGVAQFSKAKPPNEGPKVPSLGVAQCMVAVHVGCVYFQCQGCRRGRTRKKSGKQAKYVLGRGKSASSSYLQCNAIRHAPAPTLKELVIRATSV